MADFWARCPLNALVKRRAQDLYVDFQFFSGQVYFEPRLSCDPARISRFRRVLGEAGVEQLLKTTIEAGVVMGAVDKTQFERVIVDTSVQSKAIAHPIDSRLLEVARQKIARLANRASIKLKQTQEHQGQTLRRRAGGAIASLRPLARASIRNAKQVSPGYDVYVLERDWRAGGCKVACTSWVRLARRSSASAAHPTNESQIPVLRCCSL